MTSLTFHLAPLQYLQYRSDGSVHQVSTSGYMLKVMFTAVSVPDWTTWEILVENPLTVCQVIRHGFQCKVDIIRFLGMQGILFMTIWLAPQETQVKLPCYWRYKIDWGFSQQEPGFYQHLICTQCIKKCEISFSPRIWKSLKLVWGLVVFSGNWLISTSRWKQFLRAIININIWWPNAYSQCTLDWQRAAHLRHISYSPR